VTELKIG